MSLDLRGELPTGALGIAELEAVVERVLRRVLRERDDDVLVDDAGAADAIGIKGPTPQHRARSLRARIERGSMPGLLDLAIGVGRARRWRLGELRAWAAAEAHK